MFCYIPPFIENNHIARGIASSIRRKKNKRKKKKKNESVDKKKQHKNTADEAVESEMDTIFLTNTRYSSEFT